MQGERGLLGRAPGTADGHRVRQVDQQAYRGAGPAFGLPHFEVLGRQPDPGRITVPVTWVLNGGVGPAAERGGVPEQRVPDSGGGVDRLLVPELPGPRGAGVLTSLPRVALLMIPVPAFRQLCEDPAQRGLAQSAHRLGGQFQLARRPLQVPLPFQLAFGLPQRLHVVHGRPSQGPPDRGLVDVVQPGSGVVLAQRGLQLGQVRQVGKRGGGIPQVKRAVAGHRLARPAVGVQLRAACAQRVGQPGHLRGQALVGERLLHQRGELVPLVRAER